MVTKYPRTGRPTKKLFRFSFVEGRIYLTWKGKLGNQGVDLGEVGNEEKRRGEKRREDLSFKDKEDIKIVFLVLSFHLKYTS